MVFIHPYGTLQSNFQARAKRACRPPDSCDSARLEMHILRELKKQFVIPSFAVLVGRSSYLCLLLLLCTVQLRADVTGSISGYVRDASGGVLPNATLTVTQTTTGYTRTAATDGSGHYNILALPPGSYRLTASNAGFENGVVDKITLNVNDELKFDFDLKIGNVSQTVSVDASTVQVDTANTSMGTTISSSQILSMPLNGRSYLD